MGNEFATKVLKDMAEMAEMASDPEKQAAFEEEMRQQEERRKKIDDLCLLALESMSVGMCLIQEALTVNSLTNKEILSMTGNLAKLGSAMAQMRLNMGFGSWPAGGFGYSA